MHYTIPERDTVAAQDQLLPYSTAETTLHVDNVGHTDYCSDDLRDTLLAAMVVLASKSKRRQADLSAALLRMNLPVTAEQVMAALRKLREEGCVQDWIPLYDGGMLVSVTNRGMDETNRIGSWRFLEQVHSLTG